MGVSLPGQYSSPGSLVDARELAARLGMKLKIIEINEIFDSYRNALAPVFAGLPEDVTEENIQSRIRGAILMALSNKFNGLVLTTGNKSELAVGYCTLYGDMVGGLAVISDVPKTMVYRLSYYVNSLKPVIPKSTLEKPPSAELRPGQKDSDVLPPYEVLDNILEDYVEDYRTAEQIAADRGYDVKLVRDVIRMIERSEYKRQQAAPGLKITPKAFGLGRRFPIAQKTEV
jgi:NAD+ synthetase